MKTPDPEVKETQIKWSKGIPFPPDPPACQHYFEFVEGEARCKNCHMGLLGVVNIVDGKPT